LKYVGPDEYKEIDLSEERQYLKVQNMKLTDFIIYLRHRDKLTRLLEYRKKDA